MTKGFKNEMAMERCKHGMVKLWCGICQNYQPTITKKETTKAKKTDKKTEWQKQPKKYPGIFNQPYKMCGVRQCADNSKNERCPQPVYDEHKTLCYYHQKIKEIMCEQTKESYRNRRLHHCLIQDVTNGRTTFVDESLTDIVNKYGQTTYLKNEHMIGEGKIIKILI